MICSDRVLSFHISRHYCCPGNLLLQCDELDIMSIVWFIGHITVAFHFEPAVTIQLKMSISFRFKLQHFFFCFSTSDHRLLYEVINDRNIADFPFGLDWTECNNNMNGWVPFIVRFTLIERWLISSQIRNPETAIFFSLSLCFHQVIIYRSKCGKLVHSLLKSNRFFVRILSSFSFSSFSYGNLGFFIWIKWTILVKHEMRHTKVSKGKME